MSQNRSHHSVVYDARSRFAHRAQRHSAELMDTLVIDARPHFHVRRLRAVLQRLRQRFGGRSNLRTRAMTNHYLRAAEGLKPPVVTLHKRPRKWR